MGSLASHKSTIDACLSLHNFIVDYREEKKKNALLQSQGEEVNEQYELEHASDMFMVRNPFHVFGTSATESATEEYSPRGRRTNLVNRLREEGKVFRDIICATISNKGMARPMICQLTRRDRHYRTVKM